MFTFSGNACIVADWELITFRKIKAGLGFMCRFIIKAKPKKEQNPIGQMYVEQCKKMLAESESPTFT